MRNLSIGIIMEDTGTDTDTNTGMGTGMGMGTVTDTEGMAGTVVIINQFWC